MNTFFKLITFISLFCVMNVHAEEIELSSAPNSATAKDGLEQELAELIQIYSNGSREQQMLSVNSRIRFSGITDTALFDIAEKNMLAIPRRTTNNEDVQYASWMAQMLAFSGQEKYKASLNKFLLKGKIDGINHHVTTSLEVLPKYQRWNAIISQNLKSTSPSELGRTRVINMLNADDPELVRSAASLVDRFYLADEEITDLVEKQLLVFYPKATGEFSKRGWRVPTNQYDETSSWLCKILGNTKKQKYASTLTQIVNSNRVPTLRRWAQKSLNHISAPQAAPFQFES